jgi:PadR family transcriptional regulator, regulatory protein PadR
MVAVGRGRTSFQFPVIRDDSGLSPPLLDVWWAVGPRSGSLHRGELSTASAASPAPARFPPDYHEPRPANSTPIDLLCAAHYHGSMNNRNTNHTEPPADVMDKLNLELRRGVIVLACLSQLDEPRYGYGLQQRMADLGMEIDQGTLYPLLRRLEEQRLLAEEWNVEGPRPRKYYRLTPMGQQAREALRAQWNEMTAVLERLLSEDNGGRDGSD